VFEPIWAAAAGHGLPVAVHINGGNGVDYAPTFAGHTSTYPGYAAFMPLNSFVHLATLIIEGVFGRHADLRFVFADGGYTKEELKMINETRKILNEPDLPVTATTVRVPVFCSHSESVNVETEKKLSVQAARELLREAPGILLVDEPENNLYPMAIDAVGKDATYVGRIREDNSIANGLNLWVVADNLRKGAALNAVQIAEILIRDYI
jgi:hypothetical protein